VYTVVAGDTSSCNAGVAAASAVSDANRGSRCCFMLVVAREHGFTEYAK
jgi:hypothetical protein